MFDLYGGRAKRTGAANSMEAFKKLTLKVVKHFVVVTDECKAKLTEKNNVY